MKHFMIVSTLAATAFLLPLAASPAAAQAADPFLHRCPKEALEEGTSGKLNHNPAAKHAIVPAGAVGLRICRYWGFGNESGRQTPKTQARAGELHDQAEIHNRPVLEGLTDEFKELEAAPKGPINCPADDGTELYAVFFYRHAQPVILDVSLSGCRFVSGAAPRARWLNESLQRKLVRLVKGERVQAPPKRGEVKKASVAEYPPPHLTYAEARQQAKDGLEGFCEESELCRTQSIGHCKRKSAKAFRCHYSAELLSGEKCEGGISVKALGERMLMVTPGVLSEDEGECFFLFAPPHFKEELEEMEREETQERERGKRSSRATGQPGRRT